MLTQKSNFLHSKNEDLTVSQKTIRDLESSEMRYRRVFETAQDGILLLDAGSGKILDVNPFLIKILGYTKSEILGKELWQIGVFKDIVDSKAAFLELQTKKYIRYEDLPLETKNGEIVDVEFISNSYGSRLEYL